MAMRVLNLPPVTRACIGALIILSTLSLLLRMNTYRRLVSAAEGPQVQPETDERPLPEPVLPLFKDIVVPYLTVVTPALSVLYPWVILTTSFVETSVMGFVLTGATLVFGGRYCERVWSTKELAWFVGLQSVVPVLVTSLLLVIKYILTIGSATGTEGQFHVVNGGTAFQLAFLVALKQLVPEHSIVLFRGMFTVKVKHLVMPVLIFYSLFGAFLLRRAEVVLLAWSGFFSSWVYLRFFRVTYVDPVLPSASSSVTSTGSSSKAGPGKTRIKGDASEVFALSTFFYPGPLRDVIHAASRVVFHTLVAIKVCTPFNQDEVEQGNLRASMRTAGHSASAANLHNEGHKTAAQADAERRRAIALKVLEERLDNTRRPT